MDNKDDGDELEFTENTKGPPKESKYLNITYRTKGHIRQILKGYTNDLTVFDGGVESGDPRCAHMFEKKKIECGEWR